jgi:inhibitor of KinA sporulation pathway (predicted exonuclease)
MCILLVIDVEATCWKDYYHKKSQSEIIEIGGVILIEKNGELIIANSFSEFIKPKINPILSDFCKKLTSIKQEDIDDALSFNEALRSFINKAKESVGGISCKKMVFASWGNWDKKMLKKECKRNNKHYPFGRYWDISKGFSLFLNEKRSYGVSNALKKLNLDFIGTPHRAVSDAFNTSRIIQRSMNLQWQNYLN